MEPFALDPPELTDGAVVLRRVTEEMVPEVVRSFEIEPGLDAMLGFDENPGEEKFLEWLPTRDTGVWLAIVDPADGRYLGDVAVHQVNWDNARAELGFYTLVSERRRGLMAGAIRLVTSWLFDQGFVRVQMLTLPSNEPVHGLARRVGFEREGLLRSYFVERGKPTDAVMFSAIATEWTR